MLSGEKHRKRRRKNVVPIYCEAHKGVFMVDLKELEGKSEVTCGVCGTKLAFMPKDPLQMMTVRIYNILLNTLEKTISDLDRFLGEDWRRKHPK